MVHTHTHTRVKNIGDYHASACISNHKSMQSQVHMVQRERERGMLLAKYSNKGRNAGYLLLLGEKNKEQNRALFQACVHVQSHDQAFS